MKYSLEIIPEKNLIKEIWEGELSYQDMIESWTQHLLSHPDYIKGLNLIADYRNAQIKITGDEVRSITEWINTKIKVQYLAIVVNRTVDYGISRMFQSLSEGNSSAWEESQLFYSFDEAVQWVESKNTESS